jgi:hypothetical protein
MDIVGVLVIQGRMASATIVEAFNVADDVFAGLVFGGVNRAVNALIFQGGKERFCCGIIPALSG